MLKELIIEYGDGRKETRIVPNDEAKIYPKRDNITFCYCRPFKYKVKKHAYLCVAIANFGNKHVIMPAGIVCHPKTTLDDIIEIDDRPKVVEKAPEVKQPSQTWKFESSSGGGTYVVKMTPRGLTCDCPGRWRAKDKKCKHMKEIEKELGLVK
jgi:hypothetical protein